MSIFLHTSYFTFLLLLAISGAIFTTRCTWDMKQDCVAKWIHEAGGESLVWAVSVCVCLSVCVWCRQCLSVCACVMWAVSVCLSVRACEWVVGVLFLKVLLWTMCVCVSTITCPIHIIMCVTTFSSRSDCDAVAVYIVEYAQQRAHIVSTSRGHTCSLAVPSVSH